MRSLRSLLAWPADGGRLFIACAALIGLFQIVLWVAPFSRSQDIASRLGARGRTMRWDAERICWAFDVAERRLPIGSCLSRALAAHVVLMRSGLGSQIRIGVAREAGNRFLAHAWVESHGIVVVGGGELERYVAVTGPGRIL